MKINDKTSCQLYFLSNEKISLEPAKGTPSSGAGKLLSLPTKANTRLAKENLRKAKIYTNSIIHRLKQAKKVVQKVITLKMLFPI